MKHTGLLFLLLLPIFLSSCVRSGTEIGRRFEALFFVQNLGDDIIYGTDTLTVTEFKFSVRGLTLTTEEDVELGNNNTLIYGYNSLGDQDVLVISSEIGFEVDGFTDFEYTINPVRNSDQIFDNEFFGTSTNYSLIIEGLVNGEFFMYRASPSFTRSFSFEPVRLSDQEETIFIRTVVNVDGLFTDENDEFLDPRDSDNNALINANVRDAIGIEAYAGTIFF